MVYVNVFDFSFYTSRPLTAVMLYIVHISYSFIYFLLRRPAELKWFSSQGIITGSAKFKEELKAVFFLSLFYFTLHTLGSCDDF